MQYTAKMYIAESKNELTDFLEEFNFQWRIQTVKVKENISDWNFFHSSFAPLALTHCVWFHVPVKMCSIILTFTLASMYACAYKQCSAYTCMHIWVKAKLKCRLKTLMWSVDVMLVVHFFTDVSDLFLPFRYLNDWLLETSCVQLYLELKSLNHVTWHVIWHVFQS